VQVKSPRRGACAVRAVGPFPGRPARAIPDAKVVPRRVRQRRVSEVPGRSRRQVKWLVRTALRHDRVHRRYALPL